MRVKCVGIDSKGRATRAFGRLSARWDDRNDAGMSLIECVVAIALLIIVLVPTTLFVIEGQKSASQSHLQAEATTLADEALNGLQAEASRGNLPGGFQSVTQNVDEVGGRKTVYTISTTWTPIVQGTNKDICAAGVGVSVAEQIWLVTATVTWNAMGGAAPISATTELSPGTDGGLQQSAGELAVTLDSGVGSNIFTGASVTATMTGSYNNPGSPSVPAVPSGEFTTETRTSINAANGKFDGCLVFENLDADPGWTYTLSFAGNPTITQAFEYSDSNPNGAYTEPITLQVGVPQIVTVNLNLGTQINIVYTQGPGGSCTTGTLLTAPATTSEIPVTVNNTSLSAQYPTGNGDWVAYKSGGPTFNSLLLYPSYTSTTSIWAGDGPNGEQASPCTVNPSSAVAQTVYLQLYKLTMTLSGPGTLSTITALENGSDGALYTLTPALPVLGTTSTDLPLGEYAFTDSAGNTLTSSGGSSVWVTAGGDCISSSPTPPTTCNSPIAMTAP